MPIVIQQYAPVLKTIAAIMKLMHDEKKLIWLTIVLLIHSAVFYRINASKIFNFL